MRRCSKCDRELVFKEDWSRPRWVCPDCWKLSYRAFREKNYKQEVLRVRESVKKAYNNPIGRKQRLAHRRFIQHERWMRLKDDPIWREKQKARQAVRKALRNGQMMKPVFCQRCGESGRILAHHHRGYDLEHHLDVIWLCTKCHLSTHGLRT